MQFDPDNMNISDSEPLPAVERRAEEELFQRIAPQIGLDPAEEPRRNYHTAYVLRYRTPKVVMVLILVVALALAAMLVVFPYPLTEINVAFSGTNQVDVGFSVNPLDVFTRITGIFNGVPVDLIPQDHNSYNVTLDENGQLVLTVESPLGLTDSKTVNIDCLDDTAPRVVRHFRQDNDIYIYLEDDRSGVDWDGVTASGPGGSQADFTVHPDEGYVAVAFPQQALTLRIPDMAGNALSVVVDLLD